MDRIIEVKVCGNHLTKDSKCAGVKGEANVTKLRITFDEGWDGYEKKITFWDAYGLNPIKVELTTNLLENISRLSIQISENLELLEKHIIIVREITDALETAQYYREKIFLSMVNLRCKVDELETIVGSKYWEFPTYSEILYSVK